MFKSSCISVNENMLFLINNDIANEYFLKVLIKFFEKYDILSYVLNQNDNEEERTRFFNNSLIELKNNDLTENELSIVVDILKTIYFSIKDEFNIELKKN